MSKEIALAVMITAKPGKKDEMKGYMQSLIEPTRKEKGCLLYDLHESLENPDMFMWYEVWDTQEDLDAHHHSAHVLAYKEKVKDLVADRQVFKMTRVK